MTKMEALTDNFGRRLSYLRLSVTEACNFRCSYCLPEGYRRRMSGGEITLDEIRNLLGAFGELGFEKVRITGGEPSTRKDLAQIVSAASECAGINRVALSSNGFRLAGQLPDLKLRGLSALNVSVDSLDPERFARITGQDRLGEVLDTVDMALSLGLEVKANAVLLSGLNDNDIEPLIEWTRLVPLTVRFIELMETGEGAAFFGRHHSASEALLERLRADSWSELPRRPGAGPARELRKEGYRGAVGIIAPYSPGFCTACNRLRVDSRGAMKLCLFSEDSLPLRHLLASPDQRAELKMRIRNLVERKAEGHGLLSRRTGNTYNLSMIGG